MLVDGKAIATEIIRETSNMVTHLSHAPHAMVVTCAPKFETQKYLALKLRRAKEAGIALSVVEFSESATTAEMITSIERFTMQTDAVVVQLPLPAHIDTAAVLAAVPLSYDADGMHHEDTSVSKVAGSLETRSHYESTSSKVLSPVVGAIAEIGRRYGVEFSGRNVVIVGQGRLVGKPVAAFMRQQGAHLTVLEENSEHYLEAIMEADVLVLGAGVPKLITPPMIKSGVAIFDAGTSEDGGVLVGDADPACAEKASILTPVPGGIGPVTVSVLLRNIALLASMK